MTRPRDFAALQGLARLLLDHRLSRLRQAVDRCDQTRMQIAALDRPAEPDGLELAPSAQVSLRYQHWADVRRSELNTVLARQTAEWLAAREDARHAFGRAEALRGIAGRMKGRD